MYEWMKEHKKQRNQVLLVGLVEICMCILFFIWYAKTNNWNVNNSELTETHDFAEIYNLCKKALSNISVILSIIVAIFGGSIVSMIKSVFLDKGKMEKISYWIIGKQRDLSDKYKLIFISYVQLFIGLFEWSVPIYIFAFIVEVIEKIFELKKQINVMELNLIMFGLLLGAVIVICITYIITKRLLYSVTVLLIYCLCILGLVVGFFIETSKGLYMIITILSIVLSEIILNIFHKFDMVKRKGSLGLCISIVSRDIVSVTLLVGIIFFNMPYIYEITYIMFAIMLLIEFIFEMYKNEDDLRDIYISYNDGTQSEKTQMGIRKIGDMVMYTTIDKIEKMINCKTIKNISYSCKLSLLENMQYRKIAGQQFIYAELKGGRVHADKYRIKNDWIYFYNIYNGEVKASIYKLSDCIELYNKTELVEID